MSNSRKSKVRVSVDCSAEERKLIRLLAALEDKTISDYLLSLARSKMQQISSLRSSLSQEKSSKEEDATDGFWKSMGFTA